MPGYVSAESLLGAATVNWVVIALVLIVALGWWLSYTAARLDRLHVRLEGTYAALDAQLVRRAEAAVELANSGILDGATGLILAGAAAESLASTAEDTADREVAESDLTAALEVALTPEVAERLREGTSVDDGLLDKVLSAGRRVQLARRFHNDTVTDVRRVRRQLPVKLFRLAGHTEMPRTVEFDDELPKVA